nr:MAG TPA: hypothetical protein [Caudoviricetes sp.]
MRVEFYAFAKIFKGAGEIQMTANTSTASVHHQNLLLRQHHQQ